MADMTPDCSRLQIDDVPRIGHIEEIMVNILPRLPAKTAVKCKTVCKFWSRLISEPEFPTLHLKHSKNNPKCVLCPYSRETAAASHLYIMEGNGEISQSIQISGIENIPSSDISCSSKGLFLSVEEDTHKMNMVHLRIFNPYTRDVLQLPLGTRSAALPCVGALITGNNEFKVFRFYGVSSHRNFSYKCEVFASGSTSWRTISNYVEILSRHPWHQLCPRYANVDESLYWFVNCLSNPGVPLCILSINQNEEVIEIRLPGRLSPINFLFEFEGCLAVLHVVHNFMHSDEPMHLEIFKYVNDSWHLRSRVEFEPKPICQVNSVVAYKNEMFFIVRLEDNSLWYVIFNADKGTFTTLDHLSERFARFAPFAFPFVESLLKWSGA
ncbi:F-box protein At5g49610-like [Andrographis paniculata]|uniref:F-box protein At5g49610-like n=1 Tax=Andrographis paniculata TaxID=175694 RepID=UPI0021E8A7F5|nr:F-box protein At5g49610-like [Andrographis paniculata]XP_051152228.1 F-box protein At5g49610-like [Andrographis paniculata]XP_051152229.1 F-box protein At5g49610-like [Andrographis paniculata]XP_051152230.1 F-box protein At5g49610-like [Andrographis paniculata]